MPIKSNPLSFRVGGKAYFVCFCVGMTQPLPVKRFKMVTKPDDFLKVWWAYMGSEDKKIIKTHIGHLPSLLEMDVWPEMIHVLTEFWDDDNMVFRFGEVELAPTIEEVVVSYESIHMCNKRKKTPDNNVLVPEVWNRQKIKDAFLIKDDTWLGKLDGPNIPFRELYYRFGRFNSFQKFGHEFASESEWKDRRAFAFAVSLLGTMVFPQGLNGTIHPRVIMVTHALFYGLEYGTSKVFFTLAPMIITEIYRALGNCQKGAHFF